MTQVQFSAPFQVGLLEFATLGDEFRLVFANAVARALLDEPLRHGEEMAAGSALGTFLASGAARDRICVRRQGQLARWLEAEAVSGPDTLHVALREVTEQHRLESLHHGIRTAQHRYLATKDPEGSIRGMLQMLLELTESDYGFIGEQVVEEDGCPGLQLHAYSTFDGMTREEMSDLFRQLIRSGGAVIVETLDGHPELRDFLGVPLQSGEQVTGMIGIANRPGGYDQALVDWLTPYVETCALLMSETRNIREKRQIAQRLNEVISSTRDFFVTFDPTGTILSANQAVTLAFELTPDEVIGRNFIEFVAPEERDRAAEGFAATLEGENVHDFDVQCVTKTGRRFWTRWNAKSAPGVKKRIDMVGSDITRHRRDGEQLRLLALIAERTETSIIVCNADHKMVWVNPALTRATGFSLDDAIGKHPSELLAHAPADLDQFRQAREAVARGGSYSGEAMSHAQDGRILWSFNEIRTIRDDAGELLNYVILSTDITDRKLAELRIREQQELLERTGRAARVGGWEADLETGTIRWSSEVHRIHEVDQDYVPARISALAFYTDEARAIIAPALEATKSEGTPFDLELQMITAKGNRIWVRVTGEATRRDRHIVRIFGSMQDITNRKLAELKSMDQQAMLERTGRTARIGGWEAWCSPFRVIWSSEMYKIHEVDEDFEITSESSLRFYPEAAQRLLANAVEAAGTRGEPFDIEVPFVSATGRELQVRLTGDAELDNGECVRIYGSMQDVTERWQSQREAREVSERLYLALQAAGLATWKWDLIAGTVWWDEDMYRLHGMNSSAPITTERFKKIVRPKDYERFAKGLFGAKRKRADHALRYEALIGNELRHFAGRALVQRDETGAPIAVFGVCRDETAERRSEAAAKTQLQALELAQAALAEAKERAEHANRAKGDFLAVVSHEIRTPLNGILGMARLLMESPLEAEEHEMASTVLNSAESLLGIINDILDFSKIEAGRLELVSTELHMAQLVEDTADLLEPRAAEKGLVIGISVSPSVPRVVRSDPGRLRQVILNLL